MVEFYWVKTYSLPDYKPIACTDTNPANAIFLRWDESGVSSEQCYQEAKDSKVVFAAFTIQVLSKNFQNYSTSI